MKRGHTKIKVNGRKKAFLCKLKIKFDTSALIYKAFALFTNAQVRNKYRHKKWNSLCALVIWKSSKSLLLWAHKLKRGCGIFALVSTKPLLLNKQPGVLSFVILWGGNYVITWHWKSKRAQQGGAWTRWAVPTACLGSNQVTEQGGEQYEDEGIWNPGQVLQGNVSPQLRVDPLVGWDGSGRQEKDVWKVTEQNRREQIHCSSTSYLAGSLRWHSPSSSWPVPWWCPTARGRSNLPPAWSRGTSGLVRCSLRERRHHTRSS